MRPKHLVAIVIFITTFLLIISLAMPARVHRTADANFKASATPRPRPKPQEIFYLAELNEAEPEFGCKLQPPQKPAIAAKLTSQPVTMGRFRQDWGIIGTNTYKPREIMALAAPSNYGDRYLKDVNGKSVTNNPLIVLHETVAPTDSVIGYFQGFQNDPDDQASYHTLIALDGTVIYLVPPDKRAYGAGNSAFNRESVKTNRQYPSSVNNFAYHISLETPPSGMHDGRGHSGYTNLQYQSLAWLIAKTDVPTNRITTHQKVDRSNSRIDPRSFSFKTLEARLRQFPRTREIQIGCPE